MRLNIWLGELFQNPGAYTSILPIRSMTNLGSRAITWTSALSMICNALLPNEVLGSMGGGILGESNLKKLLVTV